MGIVIPIALAACLYAAGSFRIYSRNRLSPAISRWRVLAFAAGWLTLVIALVSPLHKLGSVLFSAHMTQHELLMVVAAPLLVMGRPLIPFLFAVPHSWRTQIGGWTTQPSFRRTWRWLTAPALVWALHGATLWLWHVPALYEVTLDHEGIHALQHLCFLGTALLFWWTLMEGRHGRLAYGAALVYLFTTGLHSSALGALITFAQRLWYPIYDGRTAAWGLSPLEDQQLGGLIMWVPSGVVFLLIALALLAAWLGESERRLRHSRYSSVLTSGSNHAD